MPVAEFIQPRSASVTRGQRGDTMLEVLVTIIVIAIGVLGAAALQVTTLKNLSSSHSATVAALVAEDLGERMRANTSAALADEYLNPPGPFTDCSTNPCDETQLAAFDLGTWSSQLTDLLPSGSGQVTRNVGTDTFVVTIRWDEDRSGSSGVTCPPQSANDLECYQLEVTI